MAVVERRYGWAAIAVGLITLAVVAALWGRDPLRQDLMLALAPPSIRFPLGTDHLGRDVFARLLHAFPRSIGIAVVAMASAAFFGTVFGLLAATFNRVVDGAMMRLTDLALAFPGLLLAMVLAGLMGGGTLPVLLGIALAQWPQFTRMTRSIAATVLTEPHVEASRIAGITELLPHMDVAPVQIAAPCVALFSTVLVCMTAGQRMTEAR